MSKAFPLQTLLDLSHDRVDDATRRLGELIAREQEVERKLELLREYRAEYEARFFNAARNGIGPDAWRNYSAFIGRIDEAISVQASAVAQSKRSTLAGQQAWMHERNRMRAFDTLQQRHQSAEAKKLAKQEQRLADEHAAKRFRERDEDA